MTLTLNHDSVTVIQYAKHLNQLSSDNVCHQNVFCEKGLLLHCEPGALEASGVVGPPVDHFAWLVI